MRIDRGRHRRFLEEELQAQTEAFRTRLNTRAEHLLSESGDLFTALFAGFRGGEMVVKFPRKRALPRKGAHLYCLYLPQVLRTHANWGDRTYRDLCAARYKGTDCVCVWMGPSDDERFTLAGFKGVDVAFAEMIAPVPGMILVFGPERPPIDYLLALQQMVDDPCSQAAASVLDAAFESRPVLPRLLGGDDPAAHVLAEMADAGTVILQGPPGTGKTYTLAQICARLQGEGKSVLVTALTNRALMELASQPVLQPLVERGLVEKVNLTSDERSEVPGVAWAGEIRPKPGRLLLATFYVASVYAAAATEDGTFDVLLMDEASQALTAMFAAAAKIGRRNIWVGDVNQLPPVVEMNDDWVRSEGYAPMVDGLVRMAGNPRYPVLQLTRCYRLGARATSYTGMFYQDSLVSARGRLSSPSFGLDGVLDPGGGPVLVRLELDPCDRTPGPAIACAVELVRRIRAADRGKRIAVLSCMVKTTAALQRALADQCGEHVLVETVARVQGLTTDIVVFVVPFCNYLHGLGRRLFNVATSRAREHTVIVADSRILDSDMVKGDVRRFLERLDGESRRSLPIFAPTSVES